MILKVKSEASALHLLKAKVEQEEKQLAVLHQDVMQLYGQMMRSARIHLMTCATHILKTALGARSHQVGAVGALNADVEIGRAHV